MTWRFLLEQMIETLRDPKAGAKWAIGLPARPRPVHSEKGLLHAVLDEARGAEGHFLGHCRDGYGRRQAVCRGYFE